MASFAVFALLSSFVLPLFVSAVLLNFIYVWLTGGLHLDGLGDTFDGVFSWRTKERMREIMKDSRVGSNAVIILVLILLLNTVLYYEVAKYKTQMILLMPAAGRMGIVIAAGISKYARSEGGIAKSFIEYCGKKQVLTGFAIFLVISACFANLYIIIAVIVSCLFAFVAAKYFGKKIDGITGDILGAVCELTQTVFMLLVCTLEKLKL